jgi:UDP-glucose 4-epimerase
VYGNSAREVLSEDDLPSPFSPYGVTKLAAEHLAASYHANFGVPAVTLRFFTVFGPRQRPDMAFQRIVRSLLEEQPFVVYGDGEQVRDFTYVDDIVSGCLLAGEHGIPGAVYNLGGANAASMNAVFGLLEKISGKRLDVRHVAVQKGDVRRTRASIRRAQEILGYSPNTPLAEGLQLQWDYVRASMPADPAHPA